MTWLSEFLPCKENRILSGPANQILAPSRFIHNSYAFRPYHAMMKLLKIGGAQVMLN